MVNPAITSKKRVPAAHGGGIRGDNFTPRSQLFEGRFGRMFRSLPAAEWCTDALRELGRKMVSEPERDETNPKLPKAPPEKGGRIQDDEENSGIAAGYTYLGQFIDHDITFDPASSLQRANDPDALVDFRTPRLDLDSLYGHGPEDQPYMYIGRKFRLGRQLSQNGKPTKARDLARYDDPFDPGTGEPLSPEDRSKSPKRAIIGDKRNDENVIVCQLQSAMLQFHNKLVDEDPHADFKDIQARVRWHYQWIVVNDFLPTICGRDVVNEILPDLGANKPAWDSQPKFAFYKWREDPFIPIEFSAAAYRFGHSMVRPIYRLNTQLKGGDDPSQATPEEIKRGMQGRFFIFAGVQKRGLNGFDAFPPEWAIDWSLFFDIGGSIKRGGMDRVQPAYKIDTSLVNPLGFLPEFCNPAELLNPPLTIEQLQSTPIDEKMDPANLAMRNLLRGLALGLPSGQAVAELMGIEPIDDKNLRVGKAVLDEWHGNKTIADISPEFKAKAPLWYYVLAEAQYEWFKHASAKGSKGNNEPVQLGPVGGRIVAETLLGLLYADGSSYVRRNPNWKPSYDIRTMGDLLEFVLS